METQCEAVLWALSETGPVGEFEGAVTDRPNGATHDRQTDDRPLLPESGLCLPN